MRALKCHLRQGIRVRQSPALVAIMLSLSGLPAWGQSSELAGSEWRPQWTDGATSAQGDRPYIRFEVEGRIAGSGGCNRFFGSYKITGNTIEFGPLGATRMACPKPAMDRESALFAVIEATRTFKRDRARLTLFDASGKELLELAQTDWD
jgi:heat shock protein HslJ